MEIKNKLKAIIKNEILLDTDIDFNDDEELISSGLVDSMKIVNLSILIENEFNIKFNDSEIQLDRFNTLNLLEELIKEKL